MPDKERCPALTDIREDDLLELSPKVLDILLRDHTTGKKIFWATHDYEALGKMYDYHSEIRPELITGEHGMVIRPRVLKSKENQTDRSKDMAEVFTPSWICNAQNNLVEDALPNDMTWQDYVHLTCLEITCGEAPYLVSRYDAATGESIPLEKRIGLLDRKLRLVNEKTDTKEEWLKRALIAYQNTYGYEWQGDDLLIARKALLLTFIENYLARFNEPPSHKDIEDIADVISWNLWQMDGLKYGIPGHNPTEQLGGGFIDMLYPPAPEERYCRIFDWEKQEEVIYAKLIKQ